MKSTDPEAGLHLVSCYGMSLAMSVCRRGYGHLTYSAGVLSKVWQALRTMLECVRTLVAVILRKLMVLERDGLWAFKDMLDTALTIKGVCRFKAVESYL